MSYSSENAERLSDGSMPGGWSRVQASEALADAVGSPARLVCTLCPRECSLKDGDRGFCFVRQRVKDQIVLTTYGRSTGFCIDPIEKKPLNHFLPGTPVLSFGTAGCNLGCQFCQNWDISKSREVSRLSSNAEPSSIARAAIDHGCRSVAFTYNDPIIWAEYAIDTAKECRAVGVSTVAVTAGYISAEARGEFFEHMDAANVDLKAFSEDFYQKITYSKIDPVLDTLRYLRHETDVWFEITNLIIPDLNDHADELKRMCDWVLNELGDTVPIHFTAFNPDFRMTDRPPTDPYKLSEAASIATSVGIKYAYTGNVNDPKGQSTYCPSCSAVLIQRDRYELGCYNLNVEDAHGVGRCSRCNYEIAGRFENRPGNWGTRRQPIRISNQPTPSSDKISIISEANQVSTNANPETTEGQATPTPAKPLDLKSLSTEQKALFLNLAASGIATAVTGQAMPANPEAIGDMSKSIVMGAFVTLKRNKLLRACCGVLGKPMSVGPAVSAAATRTAKEDQRMAPISPCELPFLDMEVTLLGAFTQVKAKGAERIQTVEVGRHGVMIRRGQKSGLLLPAVATERNWDAERFLQAVCTKAGLPPNSWELDDAVLMIFEGRSLHTKLNDQIAVNLPNEVAPPVTSEQLAEYAKIAGQNIVAIASGGTPSYVIPHLPDEKVNAMVLSLQWGEKPLDSDEPPVETNQGNAVQVSFRPGFPLQSTLFQMCQQAAQMFQQKGFKGELKVGLTLGFDPALHGYGTGAELEGIESEKRAVVVSDSRHCGFGFEPRKQAPELHEILRQNLPIGSRDGAVHTVQAMSTMPHVISISAPTPTPASGARPAAVAGKFYPAEDAARRATTEKLFEPVEEKLSPLAIMVPHAGLKYSGKIAANVWGQVAQDDRTLVIISPKHTGQGVNWSVCPFESWNVSNTLSFESDSELAQKIVDAVDPLVFDAAGHQGEHGIEVQLPLLEQALPKSKVVGIVMQGGSREDIKLAAGQMAELMASLEKPPLLVISSDMNHYAPDAENRRRDQLALDALHTGDATELIETCMGNDISMCGLVPAAFVLEVFKAMDQPFEVVDVSYATSADVSGDKSSVVGYASVLIMPAD